MFTRRDAALETLVVPFAARRSSMPLASVLALALAMGNALPESVAASVAFSDGRDFTDFSVDVVDAEGITAPPSVVILEGLPPQDGADGSVPGDPGPDDTGSAAATLDLPSPGAEPPAPDDGGAYTPDDPGEPITEESPPEETWAEDTGQDAPPTGEANDFVTAIDAIPMDPTIELPPTDILPEAEPPIPDDGGAYTPDDPDKPITEESPPEETWADGTGQDDPPTGETDDFVTADEVLTDPPADTGTEEGVEFGDTGEPADEWVADDSVDLWSGWICACMTMVSLDWSLMPVLSMEIAEPKTFVLTRGGMVEQDAQADTLIPMNFRTLTEPLGALDTGGASAQAPSPGTLFLLPAGLAALGLARRRR